MLRGPRQRMELISSLVSDIESCLKREFPHCSIIPYGSTSTGFAFQDSDLDAFVDLQLKSLTSVGKSTDEEEKLCRVAQLPGFPVVRNASSCVEMPSC